MKKLLLTTAVSTLVMAAPFTVFAQESTESVEVPSPYTQAHDLCSKAADEQEITDGNTGEGNWNEIFETCMTNSGFSPAHNVNHGETDENHTDDGAVLDQ